MSVDISSFVLHTLFFFVISSAVLSEVLPTYLTQKNRLNFITRGRYIALVIGIVDKQIVAHDNISCKLMFPDLLDHILIDKSRFTSVISSNPCTRVDRMNKNKSDYY